MAEITGKSDARVLITGDVLKETRIFQGERVSPFSTARLGTTLRQGFGNSSYLHELVQGICDDFTSLKSGLEASPKSGEPTASIPWPRISLAYGLKQESFGNLPQHLHSMEYWKPFPASGTDKRIWRMEKSPGYGTQLAEGPWELPISAAAREDCDLLVVDDVGLAFRNHLQKAAWPPFLSSTQSKPPRWILCKTSLPLAGNEFLRALNRHADRLVLLLDAEDIRKAEVRITRAVSWERTALDLIKELRENPILGPLLQCRHLFIKIGLEGVLHVEPKPSGKPRCTLYFDPDRLEGDFQDEHTGIVFGATTSLASSLLLLLVRHAQAAPIPPDLDTSVKDALTGGLCSARHALAHGRGSVDWDQAPALDLSGMSREITLRAGIIPADQARKRGWEPEQALTLGTAAIPWEQDAYRVETWTILAANHGDPEAHNIPMHGVAARVAVQGPAALLDVPRLAFRKLLTVDRSEIENLRNVKSLMKVYRNVPNSSPPLNLGVFGAPGSGKSFAVQQIALAVFGDGVPFLEYNLSQLESSGDLDGAFQQIRDQAIYGRTPVVFWDEFDAGYYKWLQYFLAPMQDGTFQVGQATHLIGKCIFVFAGGVSDSFKTFGPTRIQFDEGEAGERDFARAEKEFRDKKGPDFASRLSGYMDVLGPNPKNDLDTCFPIRRAILLRRLLGFGDRQLVEMDRGLLSALLRVGKYKHGNRSLAKIADMLKNHGSQGRLLRSDLPPPDVISLHADLKEIETLASRDNEFRKQAAALAPVVHESYRAQCKQDGNTMDFDMDFDQLPEHVKADNVDAAARIPWLLSLAGLMLGPANTPDVLSRPQLEEILLKRIELLAEAEHDGWMESRRRNGWVYGEKRDNEKRIHPLMINYRFLPESEKKKDRDNVMNIPGVVGKAKFAVAWEKSHNRAV